MICYTNKWDFPFQVDEEDYESVSNYFWCMAGDNYLVTNIKVYYNGIHIGKRLMTLHEFLLGKPLEEKVWHHKNNDIYDNRRENLRAVTRLADARNKRIDGRNISGHPGICLTKKGLFRAYISRNELGSYDTLEEAIAARKAGELKFWGNER